MAKEFSRNLLHLRQHSGMSQSDLAKKSGCSRSAIAMYETGKREPDYETLEVFADIFDVSFNQLLGKETQKIARGVADASRISLNTSTRKRGEKTMNAKVYFTDEEVEQEIQRLSQSEYVQLARKEQRIRYRRRQYMYTLRNFERKGRELAARGVTMDSLDALDTETPDVDESEMN